MHAEWNKSRFDKNKVKIQIFTVGERVLTKLDPKYKDPILVQGVMDDYCYLLNSLSSNRNYKYPHKHLRKMH